ncbi:sulfatase-like hydrolase/transferase [Pseudooceanicola sp. CBS1P-1]|uniref:Sulfatase-like hydrolase/transferase n=1 Tax=Pseudooceanicola albus TaxID=2692189 RepID=A0A6L7G7N2_9RHOB|nr:MULTISPECIES: arylsulfatase [Pseudooceanicola]MBT9386167.1 sulfatase-like hydrolase/transferase [Pseudooceanicola endophyticus]MXN19416.1 sulfatase-like hydrolase/transferase [Pseudooceanicola albus]
MTQDTRQMIGRTHHESDRRYAPIAAGPKGQPNVIYVVLDDVGYADLGCFGSDIDTRNFDSLADNGLRYANFHTTTLCSPTRACLLTGRNHHSVGMRYIANADMGWPSGRGAIDHKAGTLAEMLRMQGFATYAVGKWHLAPTEQANAAGPFDQWPLGRGFDRFYGFMNGGTDQYYPELFEDNHPTRPPKSPEEGYHLSDDLADRAVRFMSDKMAIWPDKPFFLYLCYGAGHFPHHAPAAAMEKYRGAFAHGWDEERERRLAKQKRMGLVPADTALPDPNPGVRPWADLSQEERAVSERMQEAYAAFLDHTDKSFGRVLDFLDRTGQRENTIIVLISDNGASVDCDPDGTTNVLRWFNRISDDYEVSAQEIDQIGGPRSFGNYPWGWAQASNTPLKLYKSFTHGGGVRDPMIFSWPAGIEAAGGIRSQFTHATDITPTVLELCGYTAPEVISGVPQMPVHGESFAYSFLEPGAETLKKTQYFEMYGHRSIWHQGWKAVTCHKAGTDFESEAWELYHLDEDFSETRDLAAEMPGKLTELKERWWAEAGRYGVEPLDDSDVLFKPAYRPGAPRWRASYTFHPPLSPIPPETAPLTQDRPHSITVTVERDSPDQDGTLVCFGSCHGGYGLDIIENRLVYVYNAAGTGVTRLVSDREVPLGRSTLTFEFDKTGSLQGRGRLLIDGVAAGACDFPRTLLRLSLAPLKFGASHPEPVDPDRRDAPAFRGRLLRVDYALGADSGLMPDTLDID